MKTSNLFRLALILALTISSSVNAQSAELNALNKQVTSLYQSGQYDQALVVAIKALEIAEKELGSDHPTVANSLNNLALLYQALGQYAKAEPLHIRALAIWEKALGPDHPAVATSLNNLAELYIALGQYAKVEPLLMRALSIWEKAPGPEDSNVALGLNNLAELYRAQGQYEKAEPLLMRSITIIAKVLGPDHRFVATSLNNLALLYQAQGQYATAEPLFIHSLSIWEKAFGPENSYVALGLNNLAELYRAGGQYEIAEPLFVRSLAIGEKALGPDHPNLAMSLNNLANLYLLQDLYTKAEPLYTRSLAIREKVLGSDHPNVAMSLNNLALLYQGLGQYAKAEPLFMRALTIYEKNLGSEHPDMAQILSNSSINSWVSSNLAESITLAQRAVAIREYHLGLFLVKGSEEEKRAYMATIESDTHWAISLQLATGTDNSAATRLGLTTLLQRKGRILDAISSDVAILRERLNEQDRALLDQLSATRNQQSALYNQAQQGKTTPDLYQNEMVRLTAEAQMLEAKISSHSAEFKTKALPITLSGIQQAIPKDTALVEFAAYYPFNPKAQKGEDRWGAARYIAYVLKPRGEALSVELGGAANIDRRISELRNSLVDSDSTSELVMHLARQLDEQLMHPVRKLLGETRTIFLSPDGALNLLPFGALVDENNQYLIKNYAFTYLSSGRDLLRLQAKIPSQDPGVIMGDVDFGDTANRSQTTEVNSRALNRRSSAFVSETFLPLPGTAMEAREISKILPAAKVLTGKEATEGAIKKLNSPRILHVATHGFFLPDIKEDLRDTRTFQALGGIVRMPVTENPLLRSGLALANANLLESSGEDGVLTALETSGLNLWGTRLVVLSACETGLGDVHNGEGVFGLRRTLVIAGSESQLMTLWKVDDLATKDLMVDYYRRLVSREGRSEALRQAQLAMLSDPERQHPFYWASFIASGDWRQLD